MTVDYINSKILLLYMEEIKAQRDLDDQEKSSYDELKKINIKNNLEKPIDFKTLSPILSKAWPTTIKKIANPIDSFKNLDKKDLIVLFFKVDSLLNVRKSEISSDKAFIKLKKEILGENSKAEVSKEVQNEIEARSTNQVVSSRSIETPDQKSSNSWSYYLMIPILLFMLSTLFFGFKYNTVRKDLKEQKKKYSILENDYDQNDNKLKQKQNEIDELVNSIKYQSNTHQVTSNQNLRPDPIVEERPTEVSFPVEEPKNSPTILYAGKPSVDHFLTNISNEPLNNTTIFKLVISPNNEHLAEFEVILVDNFMTRNITNQPDDYLYRVCNNENFNKEFKREIITTKKGKAELIDGNWTVKEENKATIKFQ
ncbi:hypothetical protein [Sediminicola arcticus]|uniref:Uncharacterized protein n=1 Tax=Sediminicola arcticus TaxID=1574308 RepID=A0ABV2SPS0_9FLAO